MPTDPRLSDAIERISEALRTLVEEMDLSQDEWMTALGFLTDVGKADEFILLSDVLGLSVFVNEHTHRAARQPPRATYRDRSTGPSAPLLEAPYRLADDDEPGEPSLFTGRVSDADTNAPLEGAMLEVSWQADDAARYDVQTPNAEPHLRGRFRAGHDETFELRTIVPPPYEIPKDGPVGRLLEMLDRHAWRPAHLHLKVSHLGHNELTTMVYFEGDPWLDSDTIGSVKEPLVVALERLPADDRWDRTHALCRFDVKLRRAG